MVGLASLYLGSLEQKLKFLFDVYDVDGSGYLEKEELASMFDHIANIMYNTQDSFRLLVHTEIVNKIFITLDKNNTGRISFEEFKRVVAIEPLIMKFFLPPKGIQYNNIDNVLLSPPASRRRSRPLSRRSSRVSAMDLRKSVILKQAHDRMQNESLLQKKHREASGSFLLPEKNKRSRQQCQCCTVI
eukprot:TRINITY_DN3434_c1_g1_i1.p1 TRINITY_DN3434_c1_g1~~TRINITY_DN3434_c1_g1_i1.p1  ORF type:complete len:187 (-),score=19.52 TRINITY_DN3434_c1_g1_i1:1-561(-)